MKHSLERWAGPGRGTPEFCNRVQCEISKQIDEVRSMQNDMGITKDHRKPSDNTSCDELHFVRGNVCDGYQLCVLRQIVLSSFAGYSWQKRHRSRYAWSFSVYNVRQDYQSLHMKYIMVDNNKDWSTSQIWEWCWYLAYEELNMRIKSAVY